MKRKLLAVFVSVLLLCAMLPLGAASAEVTSGTTGKCTWTLDGTHLTISGNGKMADYDHSSRAPWGTDITSVTIEEGVTTIGDYAFYNCDALTSVTIPDSVTTIEDDAFYNCTSLTSVTIPDGVKVIGEQAFMYCTSLTSVTIPNSVTGIGTEAFVGCHFESVTIPDSVEVIGMDAFLFCHWLIAIEVDKNNPKYSSVDGVLFNKEQTTLIKYPGGKSNDYTIPDSVTTIDGDAFPACYSLKSVTIPNSVTTIGNQAFAHCKSLADIYYSGTEADRANIAIENGNDPLLNATWHYNYTPPCAHVYDDEYDADCNKCGEVREVPEKPILYGDANGDGAINARDVALLQQYIAGWDVELGK